jgi:hypothetical protein
VRELDCRLHLSTVMDYLPAMLDSAESDFAVSALARYLADVALIRCDGITIMTGRFHRYNGGMAPRQ